jgi:hypothetical protein
MRGIQRPKWLKASLLSDSSHALSKRQRRALYQPGATNREPQVSQQMSMRAVSPLYDAFDDRSLAQPQLITHSRSQESKRCAGPIVRAYSPYPLYIDNLGLPIGRPRLV